MGQLTSEFKLRLLASAQSYSGTVQPQVRVMSVAGKHGACYTVADRDTPKRSPAFAEHPRGVVAQWSLPVP